MAARHQWVRGWCRHRALEHMQELLELQAEQGVGLVEVVTKLGIILKKGLRCVRVCVCVCVCVCVRACICDTVLFQAPCVTGVGYRRCPVVVV